jgi:hypothetical protein
MRIFGYITFSLILLSLPLWAQEDSSGAEPAATGFGETDERMITPTPVGTEGYSQAFAAETPRTNYIRGNLRFGSAYDDNILPSSSQAVSDISYSVWPTISLNQSRSTVRWDLNYTPGFTFYQRNPAHNETDHNMNFEVEYRLSPYVTLTVTDAFQKTSNPLNLSTQNPDTSTSGVVQTPNITIVPPITDMISNYGNVEMTYQYAQNSMVGAKGTLSGLWYPNRNETPGLFDSTAEAGEAFYAHRLSGAHYIGVTYQFQSLVSRPSPIDTETHSALVFYTLTLQPRFSFSIFAGPEYSHTYGGNVLVNRWSPAVGASFGWQGTHASLSTTYARRTSEGGGLRVAVLSSNLGASARWQFTRTLTAGLGANYSLNNVLDSSLGDTGGHTVSGAFTLERTLGENVRMQLGYTRLRQRYSNFFVASDIPDRNYVFFSLSYQFQRPLGR